MSLPSPSRATRLMTADEVATLLGVPTSWVYQQSGTGRIPTLMLGRYRRYRRYRREAIERWLEDLEAAVSVSARGLANHQLETPRTPPAIR
jgi:excisionase family DNA binding protein